MPRTPHHPPSSTHITTSPKKEDNTSTTRPDAVGLGAALQREMEAVARRFEGQVKGGSGGGTEWYMKGVYVFVMWMGGGRVEGLDC